MYYILFLTVYKWAHGFVIYSVDGSRRHLRVLDLASSRWFLSAPFILHCISFLYFLFVSSTPYHDGQDKENVIIQQKQMQRRMIEVGGK